MKLSVSNIAWRPEEESRVAAYLSEAGVRHVEIAPPRIPAAGDELTPGDVERYRAFWAGYGVTVVAMQALLFGRPDLLVFGPPEVRQATLDHLSRMIRIASDLGASVLVFGSPVNRRVGETGSSDVRRIEKEFFSRLGDEAAAAGVSFCVEPNPVEYGCDYLQTIRNVRELYARVPSEGLGIHIDTGSMTLAGETPGDLEALDSEAIRHVHVSEPGLALTGTGGVDHASFARALHRKEYGGCISIEMRSVADGENLDRVRIAVEYVRRVYRPA